MLISSNLTVTKLLKFNLYKKIRIFLKYHTSFVYFYSCLACLSIFWSNDITDSWRIIFNSNWNCYKNAHDTIIIFAYVAISIIKYTEKKNKIFLIFKKIDFKKILKYAEIH